MPGTRLWAAWEDELARRLPVAEAARRTGRTVVAFLSRRHRLGAPDAGGGDRPGVSAPGGPARACRGRFFLDRPAARGYLRRLDAVMGDAASPGRLLSWQPAVFVRLPAYHGCLTLQLLPLQFRLSRSKEGTAALVLVQDGSAFFLRLWDRRGRDVARISADGRDACQR